MPKVNKWCKRESNKNTFVVEYTNATSHVIFVGLYSKYKY